MFNNKHSLKGQELSFKGVFRPEIQKVLSKCVFLIMNTYIMGREKTHPHETFPKFKHTLIGLVYGNHTFLYRTYMNTF